MFLNIINSNCPLECFITDNMCIPFLVHTENQQKPAYIFPHGKKSQTIAVSCFEMVCYFTT